MQSFIFVIVLSMILSVVLSKVTEKTNIKDKCEKLTDNKPFLKWIPVLFIILYFVGLKFLIPIIGATGGLILQVVCISAAVFTFELFTL